MIAKLKIVLTIVLWAVVVLAGLHGLLSNASTLGMFFDHTGAVPLKALDAASEELLLAAQFALLLLFYTFVLVLIHNRVSAGLMIIAAILALATSEWSLYLWGFVEYFIPYFYLLAAITVPINFLAFKKFFSLYRFATWMASAASLSLLFLFHYILIVGAAGQLKAQSQSLVLSLAQQGSEGVTTCRKLGMDCFSGDAESVNGLEQGRYSLVLVKIDPSRNNCTSSSYDARQNTGGLPAGKNEVFFALCHQDGAHTLIADTRFYPESRERFVAYSSLLVIAANMAWYLMMVLVTFYHRRLFAARRR